MKAGLGILNAASKETLKKSLQPLTVDPSEYSQSMQALLMQLEDLAVRMEKQLKDGVEMSKDDGVQMSKDDGGEMSKDDGSEVMSEKEPVMLAGADEIVLESESVSQVNNIIGPIVSGGLVAIESGASGSGVTKKDERVRGLVAVESGKVGSVATTKDDSGIGKGEVSSGGKRLLRVKVKEVEESDHDDRRKKPQQTAKVPLLWFCRSTSRATLRANIQTVRTQQVSVPD